MTEEKQAMNVLMTAVVAFAMSPPQVLLVTDRYPGRAVLLSPAGIERTFDVPIQNVVVYIRWMSKDRFGVLNDKMGTFDLFTMTGQRQIRIPVYGDGSGFDATESGQVGAIEGTEAVVYGASTRKWKIQRYDASKGDGIFRFAPNGSDFLVCVPNRSPREPGADPMFGLFVGNTNCKEALQELGYGAKATWSPDGTQMLAVKGTSLGGYELLLYRLPQASPKVLRTTSMYSIRAATFLTNGNILYVGTTDREETSLSVMELTQGGDNVRTWRGIPETYLQGHIWLAARPSTSAATSLDDLLRAFDRNERPLELARQIPREKLLEGLKNRSRKLRLVDQQIIRWAVAIQGGTTSSEDWVGQYLAGLTERRWRAMAVGTAARDSLVPATKELHRITKDRRILQFFLFCDFDGYPGEMAQTIRHEFIRENPVGMIRELSKEYRPNPTKRVRWFFHRMFGVVGEDDSERPTAQALLDGRRRFKGSVPSGLDTHLAWLKQALKLRDR